jgi:hypothetical protein
MQAIDNNIFFIIRCCGGLYNGKSNELVLLFYSVITICFCKKPAEKQRLVINGITPIFPGMRTRATGIIMRDLCREQFLVKAFIHPGKKITAAAIESYGK